MLFGRRKEISEISVKMRELERKVTVLEEDKKHRDSHGRFNFSREEKRDDLVWIEYRKLQKEFLQLLDDGVPLVDVYLNFVNRRWKLDEETFDKQETVKHESIEYKALTRIIDEANKVLAKNYCRDHGWHIKYSGEWVKDDKNDLWERSVQEQEALITPSTLTPGGDCLGDGSHEGYRFMCPECPYGETCAPECQ